LDWSKKLLVFFDDLFFLSLFSEFLDKCLKIKQHCEFDLQFKKLVFIGVYIDNCGLFASAITQSVIANKVWQSGRDMISFVRLPRRFTPRNDNSAITILVSLHFLDLITNHSRFFKFPIFDSLIQLSFEIFGDDSFFSFGHPLESSDLASGKHIEALSQVFICFHHFQSFDVGSRFCWRNVMSFVVFFLDRTAAVGFPERLDHGFCEIVCIKDDFAIWISGGTSDDLDHRGRRAQKSFFICIKNCK